MQQAVRIADIFDGWGGYHVSLLHAVEPLTPAQLAWRPAEHRRSVGELVRHIVLGRITWFSRMNGPGLQRAIARVPKWLTDKDGANHAVEESVELANAAQAVEWLSLSCEPVQAVLEQWTVNDLTQS